MPSAEIGSARGVFRVSHQVMRELFQSGVEMRGTVFAFVDMGGKDRQNANFDSGRGGRSGWCGFGGHGRHTGERVGLRLGLGTKDLPPGPEFDADEADQASKDNLVKPARAT